MSKKMLSEAVVRRFAKLANLSPINEYMGGNYGMNEDADEEIAADAADAGMGELPVGDEAELEMDAGEEEIVDDGEGMDLGTRETMAMDVISAVADALNIEVDIDGGEATEMDAEMPMDAEPPMDDMDSLEGGDTEEVEEEEEEMLQEALRGIEYHPSQKELISEVAKRVARRLLKAQKADRQLKAALGFKNKK
jgi:hypothetical protein